ncbi:Phosphonoacetaldehyde hydrolase [Glutamicibacter creatinolyticus]|uniref:Phosphonoacetaldehyde hydrolase n=1 Tax=Glutamicibacter creatinolyticus TaxID=162496 RepID=A0A5B7WXA4_9MICC|nr:phosphonatase-like hydrolase [Glutamicibacter creatinolyticus]QCY48559.1 Phosphonoacetaldehyde hydrolase [Glutamicibacter creatinolyticus]
MIELIVCDMAGTTVDEHGDVYRALENAVRETGVEVAADDLQTWMGAEKREAITELIRLGGGEPESREVDKAFERFRELLLGYYTQNPPTALPGVEQALRELSARGVKVALSTGFSRDVMEVLLGVLGWNVGEGELLDAAVPADEVAAGRPAPYMIHRAMEQTGVQNVARVLAAGDTVNDLLAARNAGVHAVGVLTGKLQRAELEEQPHDAVLEGVKDLPKYLASLDAVSV